MVGSSSFSATETATEPAFTINWWYVAGSLYLAGMLFMGIRLVWQLRSLFKLFNTYPSLKQNGFTYVQVDKKISPFSFFRYIVYNPELHDPEEMEMILKHEEVHASQFHSFDVLLANLLVIIQWGNPLAWFYTKRIEENLEYIADSETAQQVPSKKAYQLALVKASSPSMLPALTNSFYQSFIKKRIVMLNKSTSKSKNVWKLSIILPLLALFLWGFNVKEEIVYTASDEHKAHHVITSETTDADLEDIEEKIEERSEHLDVRFSDTERNSEGDLTKISIETKDSDADNFNKNVTIDKGEEEAIADVKLRIEDDQLQNKR